MHQPVLVLNANFEPLNVCTTRRAMNLILSGKASMVLNGRGEIRTVTRSFPHPRGDQDGDALIPPPLGRSLVQNDKTPPPAGAADQARDPAQR